MIGELRELGDYLFKIRNEKVEDFKRLRDLKIDKLIQSSYPMEESEIDPVLTKEQIEEKVVWRALTAKGFSVENPFQKLIDKKLDEKCYPMPYLRESVISLFPKDVPDLKEIKDGE